MAKSNGLKLYLGIDLNKFQKGLRTAENKLYRTMRKLDSVGRSLSNSVTLPALALGGAAGKVFAEFEQSMLKVKAISGATGAEFEALKQKAKKLGSTTMFTASQVAELQLNLSKLGFSSTEINKSTESILRLAQATDSDLGEAATVAAGVMKGFGLEAKDVGTISDVMANAFSSTALDMEKFKTSMATVAPVANVAGVSLEETTAILGTLVNRNIDASSAGAALRNIYLDLANKGLTWGQAMKKVKTSADPLSVAMDLFGKRGATVATVIANNADEISGLTQKFNNSSGSAKKMAEIMDSGLMGTFRRLKSQVEGVAIEIGARLSPYFEKLANIISNSLNYWQGLSNETKETAVKMALLAAATGPVLLGLSKVVGVFQLLTKTIMKTNFAKFFSPWRLALAGIAAAVYVIYKNWDIVKVALVYVTNYFIDMYNNNMLLRIVVQDIVTIFKNMWEVVKALGKSIQTIFSNLWTALTDWSEAKNAFSNMMDDFKEIGKDLAENVGDNLQDALDAVILKDKVQHVTVEMVDNFTDATKGYVEKGIEKVTGFVNKGGSGSGSGEESTEGGAGKFDLFAPQKHLAKTVGRLVSGGGLDRTKDFLKPLTVPAPDLSKYKEGLEKMARVSDVTFGDVAKTMKEKFDEMLASIGQIFGQISDVVNKFYENKYAQIEKDYEAQKEFIESSVSGERSKAHMIEEIEAEKAKKIAAIRRKEAIANKAMGIFDSIINTAVAVSSALPNAALAIAVGALGAAQTATIASQPIPALASGGLATGPTYAMVGDNKNAKVDPEVIAPLSKLKGMLNTGQNITVGGAIDIHGDALRMVLERADYDHVRRTGYGRTI